MLFWEKRGCNWILLSFCSPFLCFLLSRLFIATNMETWMRNLTADLARIKSERMIRKRRLKTRQGCVVGLSQKWLILKRQRIKQPILTTSNETQFIDEIGSYFLPPWTSWIVYSILNILRWNNFTLASFLPFPNRMSTSPSQLTPTFTSCSGLYSGNQIRMIKNVAVQYMFSKE